MEPALAIDTLHRVATPEGCEIGLRIAGPVTRARAWLYDLFIRMFGWMALATITAIAGKFGVGWFMVGVFLLEWFYPILFEVYRNGQTPGKRACDLAVLHDDGRPVGWSAAFVRNTVRFVDFFPMLYATAFVTSLLNGSGKRLGDLAAGTVVVHVDRQAGAGHAKPKSEREIEAMGAEPPPFPLSVEEQQALIEYRARVGQFTDERSLELAELPAPLVGQTRPEEARRRLLRMANFLMGRR